MVKPPPSWMIRELPLTDQIVSASAIASLNLRVPTSETPNTLLQFSPVLWNLGTNWYPSLVWYIDGAVHHMTAVRPKRCSLLRFSVSVNPHFACRLVFNDNITLGHTIRDKEVFDSDMFGALAA